LQRFISLKGFEALKKAKEVLEGKKSVESGREKLERERERDCGIWGRRGGDHISRRRRDAQQSSPSVSVELWRRTRKRNGLKSELLLFLCNSPEVLPVLF
jgi:hypothetical protein